MTKERSNDGAKCIYSDDFSILTLIKTDGYDDKEYAMLALLKEMTGMVWEEAVRKKELKRAEDHYMNLAIQAMEGE
jgi:hypothetical protein